MVGRSMLLWGGGLGQIFLSPTYFSDFFRAVLRKDVLGVYKWLEHIGACARHAGPTEVCGETKMMIL